MALRTPPSWLQNGSHPAENDRLTTQALWATTGIINSTSLAVTANSPVGMSVRVASGWAAIVGTTQANMGTYVGYNDAQVTLTITAADVTNPRIENYYYCVDWRHELHPHKFKNAVRNRAGCSAGLIE